MKASEFIMAKALEHDDFRLTKIAEELYGTEKDVDLIKEAAPLGAFLSAGKTLLKNNVIRNAAIGAGTGAVAGAANAKEGEGFSGALKGGLIGGALGGVGTTALNMRKGMATGQTLGQAFSAEGKALGSTIDATASRFNKAKDILSRRSLAVGTQGRTKIMPTIPATPAPTIQSQLNNRYASQVRSIRNADNVGAAKFIQRAKSGSSLPEPIVAPV